MHMEFPGMHNYLYIPLRKVILPTDNSVISASVIYSFLLKQAYKPLSITTIWSKDISGDLQTLFSDQIWETITSSSKKSKSSDDPLEMTT